MREDADEASAFRIFAALAIRHHPRRGPTLRAGMPPAKRKEHALGSLVAVKPRQKKVDNSLERCLFEIAVFNVEMDPCEGKCESRIFKIDSEVWRCRVHINIEDGDFEQAPPQ